MGFIEGRGSCSHITFVTTSPFKMLKVEEMKALLKGYDLNSDGFLTPHEVITSVVKSKGEDYIPTADEEDFFEMLKSFTNDDGRVKIKKVTDFFKLLEGLEKSESKGQALKATENLFKFFDENGDGKLSKAEAKVGFERLSKNVPSRPWKGDMEKVFDELKDDQGKVSIEDLMKHAEKDCPYPDSDK